VAKAVIAPMDTIMMGKKDTKMSLAKRSAQTTPTSSNKIPSRFE
jgi:hypothetical protein